MKVHMMYMKKPKGQTNGMEAEKTATTVYIDNQSTKSNINNELLTCSYIKSNNPEVQVMELKTKQKCNNMTANCQKPFMRHDLEAILMKSCNNKN